MAEHVMTDSGFEPARVLSRLGVKAAWGLLCGYPFTTFFQLTTDGPDSPFDWPADFSDFHDVRVFTPRQEWHAWRTATGWVDRFWSVEGEQLEEITLALWGTRTEAEKGAWVCLTEDNGARVWAPASEISRKKLPLGLGLIRRVAYQDNIACIVDARLTDFREHPCLRSK